MEMLSSLLAETVQENTLRDWDPRYSAQPRGAFLFEELYKRLDLEARSLEVTGVDHLVSGGGAQGTPGKQVDHVAEEAD